MLERPPAEDLATGRTRRPTHRLAPPPPRAGRQQSTAAMGAGASRAEGPCHRSLDANHATVVEYVNCTDYTVHTYWISYAGAEKRYSCLAPGASVQQPTFTSHPWTFAAPNAPPGTLCVVQSQVVFYPPLGAPGLPPPQARIECAGSLPWSPAHHPQFPPTFRTLAVALLCCHRRLSALPLASGAAAARHANGGPAPPSRRRQRQQGRCLALCCPSPPAPAAAAADDGEAAAGAGGLSTAQHLGSLPKASGVVGR